MTSHITTLLFDLDNTLIDQHSALLAWLAPYRNAIDGDEALRRFAQTQDIRVIVRMISSTTGQEPKLLMQDYQSQLMQSIQPDPATLQLLQTLMPIFTLAIVSNGAHHKQIEKINRACLQSFFSEITISGSMGVKKPHPAIFTHTLNRLRRVPEDCLFIGDDLINDIQGAHQVGMKTCWLNTGELPDGFAVRPSYQIGSLAELTALLLS